MTTLIISVHVLVCLFMIAVVLLQHGKGADSGAFSSGQGAFGPRSQGTPLSRITMFAAIIFMLTSITLAFRSSRESNETVFSDAPKTAAPMVSPVAGTPEAAPTENTLKAPEVNATPQAALTTVTPKAEGTPKQ